MYLVLFLKPGATIFESEYSTSDNVSVSEYLNCIFIMSTFNPILSDMVENYPYSNPNPTKNMKTNMILVISVRIWSRQSRRYDWPHVSEGGYLHFYHYNGCHLLESHS